MIGFGWFIATTNEDFHRSIFRVPRKTRMEPKNRRARPIGLFQSLIDERVAMPD